MWMMTDIWAFVWVFFTFIFAEFLCLCFHFKRICCHCCNVCLCFKIVVRNILFKCCWLPNHGSSERKAAGTMNSVFCIQYICDRRTKVKTERLKKKDTKLNDNQKKNIFLSTKFNEILSSTYPSPIHISFSTNISVVWLFLLFQFHLVLYSVCFAFGNCYWNEKNHSIGTWHHMQRSDWITCRWCSRYSLFLSLSILYLW